MLEEAAGEGERGDEGFELSDSFRAGGGDTQREREREIVKHRQDVV